MSPWGDPANGSPQVPGPRREGKVVPALTKLRAENYDTNMVAVDQQHRRVFLPRQSAIDAYDTRDLARAPHVVQPAGYVQPLGIMYSAVDSLLYTIDAQGPGST